MHYHVQRCSHIIFQEINLINKKHILILIFFNNGNCVFVLPHDGSGIKWVLWFNVIVHPYFIIAFYTLFWSGFFFLFFMFKLSDYIFFFIIYFNLLFLLRKVEYIRLSEARLHEHSMSLIFFGLTIHYDTFCLIMVEYDRWFMTNLFLILTDSFFFISQLNYEFSN